LIRNRTMDLLTCSGLLCPGRVPSSRRFGPLNRRQAMWTQKKRTQMKNVCKTRRDRQATSDRWITPTAAHCSLPGPCQQVRPGTPPAGGALTVLRRGQASGQDKARADRPTGTPLFSVDITGPFFLRSHFSPTLHQSKSRARPVPVTSVSELMQNCLP
jgi:hypothetical protein